MTISVIIPAAGVGKRLGRVPSHKPYLLLKGKSLLAHSLHKFLRLAEVKEIIIAIHPGDQNRIKQLLNKYASRAIRQGLIKTVRGGATRQQSVYNALQRLCSGSQMVLIHDAARPFVDPKDIKRLIRVVKKTGAGLLAIPAQDTVKWIHLRSSRIVRTLPRKQLWLAQTPQGFKTEIIIKAYQYARAKRLKATDDASLVEAMGYPVKVVQGGSGNIKITTRRDLNKI